MSSEQPIYTTRRIFKSAVTGPNVIRELLQIVFLAELVDPGDEVWLVSPWISDLALLDNRAGGLDGINPEWRRREIRLSEISGQLMAIGCRVTVVTRRDDHNLVFIARLRDVALASGVADKLGVIIRDNLHTKGILTSHGLLMGSMNLTFRGMEMNDEFVEYDTADSAVARARLAFREYHQAR